jgi:excisionase family DNA binding protein
VAEGFRKHHGPPEPPLAYGVEQAAKLVGIGRTLAWGLVRSGKLPSVRIGNRVLIRHTQLVAWLDSLPEAIAIEPSHLPRGG